MSLLEIKAPYLSGLRKPFDSSTFRGTKLAKPSLRIIYRAALVLPQGATLHTAVTVKCVVPWPADRRSRYIYIHASYRLKTIVLIGLASVFAPVSESRFIPKERKMRNLLTSAFLILVSSIFVLAQTQSGLTGVVTDPTGAIVPGAKVTLLDTKTGREQTTVTNDEGSYRFNAIEPGAGFRLTFSREGFQTVVINEVQISVGRIDTQNAELSAGAISAVVEVVSTSGDASLNTNDASIGNVISSRQLKELPIQIRGTPAALIGLQPGAVGTNVFAGATGGNVTGSVAGSRADQGNITVDGIDANDVVTGQAFATVANAPIDSIQEFRGTVAGQDASAGRSGGQVQLKTNSGSNEFHGNLREYYRNENAVSNTFFNNRNNIARPKLRRHQYGGSFGGPLPMFNFGENNGPAFRSGRDKLFFFTDVEIRRDRSELTNSRTVPLQSRREGRIGYIRQTNADTGATCTTAARADNPGTAGCIGYLTPAQIQALDPLGIGVNTALNDLYNSRFPLPNDLSGGDGRNTGLYRWNSPNVRDDKIYTFRFDATPTDRQTAFVRTTITNRDSTNALEFLPQDEDATTFKDRSWSLAMGHTWNIKTNLTNTLTVGWSKQKNYFSPPSDNPSFPYFFSGGNIGQPFVRGDYQDRIVNTPTYRDDLTWTRGSHTFMAGVSYKPIRHKTTLTLDFNFVTLGIGTSNLNTVAGFPNLRPADLLNNSTAINSYDSAFATALGRIAAVTTNFNYNASLQPVPAGTGKIRNYGYNEYEGFVQDNWKIRSDLTLNLGVRYALMPAPYEENGIMATARTDWRDLLAIRLANAEAGISGDSAEPFLTYDLAGKTNNAAPLYKTDKNNFAPRIGFAWNPAGDGFLGSLFGDRKTVIRGSYDMTHDRLAGGGILFIQNQWDYLFQNGASKNFTGTNPYTLLQTGPRFTSVNSVPVAAQLTPPVVTRPYTPFVDNGVPFGTANDAGGNSNYVIDENFKTPYSHLFSFGVQRELPGNHLIDVSYVGRLGRDLFVQSDAAQVTNFRDPASGQRLFDAFNQVQAALAACAPNLTAAQCRATVPAIPWFENQVGPATLASYGAQCNQFGLGANCTQLAISQSSNFFQIGDTSDTLQNLLAIGLINPNVGLSAQFPANAYVTNQGTSDYHGMLVSLQKRFSRGFEYELNYTFSKSLDNNSTVQNTLFGGLVCDITNPDICRGPSAFDIRHLFNANFIVDLPFGRGRAFGGNTNRFVDFFLGGWTVSGIVSARSGLPVSASPSASSFPLGYLLASPALVVGDPSAFRMDLRTTDTGVLQYFADPDAAQAALRDPRHGELGSRNAFRGPGFWGIDMGLAKKFTAPWSEGHRFTLRVDAFNLTNTPMFATPNLTRNGPNFGVISATSNTPRELQFAVRYDF